MEQKNELPRKPAAKRGIAKGQTGAAPNARWLQKHKPKNKRQEILQNPGKLKQKSTGTELSVH